MSNAPSAPTDREIAGMVRDRTAARARQDYEEADRIRDELRLLGVDLFDKRDGTTTWQRRGRTPAAGGWPFPW